MVGTRSTLKGLYLYKSKNDVITSVLFFAYALNSMEISLWKLRRLTTRSPQRAVNLRERDNDPRSMFCTDFKSH